MGRPKSNNNKGKTFPEKYFHKIFDFSLTGAKNLDLSKCLKTNV